MSASTNDLVLAWQICLPSRTYMIGMGKIFCIHQKWSSGVTQITQQAQPHHSMANLGKQGISIPSIHYHSISTVYSQVSGFGKTQLYQRLAIHVAKHRSSPSNLIFFIFQKHQFQLYIEHILCCHLTWNHQLAIICLNFLLKPHNRCCSILMIPVKPSWIIVVVLREKSFVW